MEGLVVRLDLKGEAQDAGERILPAISGKFGHRANGRAAETIAGFQRAVDALLYVRGLRGHDDHRFPRDPLTRKDVIRLGDAGSPEVQEGRRLGQRDA